MATTMANRTSLDLDQTAADKKARCMSVGDHSASAPNTPRVRCVRIIQATDTNQPCTNTDVALVTGSKTSDRGVGAGTAGTEGSESRVVRLGQSSDATHSGSARAMETRAKGMRARIADEMYTCCAFWIAVSTLPALALSYFVVRLSKQIWLRLLASKYPNLEFIRTDTVRSLLDTHRNQGIINVLLCMKGQMNTDAIKESLKRHVVERRDKKGGLMFPRLRHSLVSCWGNYAWNVRSSFSLDNHFILGSRVYRGRPVSDNNIQDYVSEYISKYFPNDIPPWQYIVIPCVSTEQKYYVLVRVHHILLTGKKSINIGDLLLVEQTQASKRTGRHHEFSQQSPLSELFPTPSAIPELWEKINENLSNAWNEFISEYDPVESPRASKSPPGAFHVAGLALVAGANALRDLAKRRSNESGRPANAASLLVSLRNECRRRNLTITKILLSPLVTADPRKWPKHMVGITLNSIRVMFALPSRLRDEVQALRMLRETGHAHLPNTFIWQYSGLVELCGRAAAEAWHGGRAAYRAPGQLWADTVRADDGRRHSLQTVSLCGRKVAAWSRAVPRASIERVARALGVSTTDVELYAATEALRSYFEEVHTESPEIILTTARAATEDFLFTFAEGDGKEFKKSQTGGMVCLSLPVGATPRRVGATLEAACSRQRALAGAWAAQARCGALTRCVPTPVAKVLLNLLSRRYAVSYAEITAPPDTEPRTMLWGHRLHSVLYWRPPQANISMSLTVIQYADSVRLAVMTDARLSPGQSVPAERWPAALDHLIARVDQEIARISARARAPAPPAPPAPLAPPAPADTLQPPTTAAVSPPPTRRVI